MKYFAETLSPLHIGDGKRYSQSDIVWSLTEIIVVDLDKIARHHEIVMDELTQAIGKGESIEKYLQEKNIDPKEVAKYFISSETKSKAQEILSFIKTLGMPFLPGSSIKGAIRTCMLWYALKTNPTLYRDAESYLREVVGNRKFYRGREVKNKYVDDKIEDLFFGRDPNHDFMRVLQISDSDQIPLNNLAVVETKTFSAESSNPWKEYPILTETVKKGVTFHGTIKKDESLFQKHALEMLKFENADRFIKDLPKSCNEFARMIIDNEIEFIEKYSPEDLAYVRQFYTELKNKISRIGNNEFFLRLAWGTGWQSKTVGTTFQQSPTFDFREIISLYHLDRGRHARIFPKTRKYVLLRGVPQYSFGWMKVRVENL